jgi:ArsR family transcriptional regulator
MNTLLPEPLQLLRAVCDPVRWQALQHLCQSDGEGCAQFDEVHACDLEGVLGLSQPTVSHHMKVLVGAGLVRSERRGRRVRYRVVPEAFQELIDTLAPFAGPVRKRVSG